MKADVTVREWLNRVTARFHGVGNADFPNISTGIRGFSIGEALGVPTGKSTAHPLNNPTLVLLMAGRAGELLHL
jgi:O-acetyl-ADP-ribose deacetylase (regulator of RNase III)